MTSSFFPCSHLTEQRSSLQGYVVVFYDQQEDNFTDFISIYIDLTQCPKVFLTVIATVDTLNFTSPLFTQLSLAVGEKN